MQQTNKRYPLGAHLIVKHLGYSHHGIYAGRGRVIHYSGLAHFIKKRPIEITSIDAFSHGKKFMYVLMMLHATKVKLLCDVCAHACTKIIII